MKQREAMLAVRGIAETILGIVGQQGKGKDTYTLTREQAEKISAVALDVTNFLIVGETP